MQTKEQRVQIAFILATIGASIVDVFLLCIIFYYRVGFYFFSNIFVTLVVLPAFASPSILGGIALSMIRGIGFRTMTGKYRVFYILVRIFGLVAIIEGAIFGTIGLVSGISTIVSSLLYGVVL